MKGAVPELVRFSSLMAENENCPNVPIASSTPFIDFKYYPNR